MTETIPNNDNDVPTDIGRNDACPCGSGKKYKKCCMSAHRVQKEATKSSREPHELIGEHTSPWDMFKLLASATESNIPKFFWLATHDLGPVRQKYASAEDYFQALGDGSENMVARDGSDLIRIRHDQKDVLLLIVRGTQAEVVTLRPNEFDTSSDQRTVEHWGWRVWNVERFPLPKDNAEITFDTLGFEWAPAPARAEPAQAEPAPA